MYQEDSSFDQSSLHGGGGGGLIQSDDGFSQTHITNCSNNQSPPSMDLQSYHENPIAQHQFAVAVAAASTLEMELQRHLEMEQCCNYNTKNGGEIQEMVQDPNWQEIASFNGENQYQNGHHTTIPDLLNMLPLPRCSSSSFLPKSSITFGLLGEMNPSVEGVVYDPPLLPLNLSPQPPFLKELFHSLPNDGYTVSGPRNGSLFSGVDERDGNGPGLNQNGDERSFNNGVFEFTAGEMDLCKNRDGKDVKHFANERHRRVLLNDKFQALKNLVPNPIKNDRASIVGDAIDYIKELKRTVAELKVVLEQKKCAKERLKRPKTEDAAIEGNESKPLDDLNINGSPSLRSSWLHRKSKNSEVDVRIIDDEVTVKLVQQKRINCLLFVSKALDELQLDLQHVAGGAVGDYYSYLFNSKICEGSIVYASAVANKLIEVVDKQYAAIPPTNSY